jgi:CheY-like chemotaxis protein
MEKLKIASITGFYLDSKILEADVGSYCARAGVDFEFHIFGSGKQLLEKISKDDFDVVFVDAYLFDSNGFELIKKLKERKENPPFVVAIVPLAKTEEENRAIGLGADFCIKKPFDFLEIYSSLETFMRGKEEQEFIDFDEFEDFDEETVFEEEEEKLRTLNSIHNKISARQLIDELKEDLGEENYRTILDDVIDIKRDLQSYVPLYSMTLKESVDELYEIFKKLADFLTFLGGDFSELGNILTHEVVALMDTIKTIEDEEFLDKVAMYFSAFIQELVMWIEEVFVKGEARDANYAVASLYDSVLEISKLLREHEKKGEKDG